MTTTTQQQPSPSGWQRLGTLVQGVNELNWFNHILDFVFKLTAFASEGLLAAGVILSTANHFQHGALFSTIVPLAHGKSLLVDTPIFQVWTWTQAIGFEASAGVVLTRAIKANQDNDKLKRNILFWLTIGLAVVGTVMLVMALVEASTGIQESSLPAWYGVMMAILRGIVSVAYVTIGRVKNLRFSGNPVMQPVEVPDVMVRLEELQSRFQGVQAQSQAMIEGVHLSVNQVSEQLQQVQASTQQQVQSVIELQNVQVFRLAEALKSMESGLKNQLQSVRIEVHNAQVLSLAETLKTVEVKLKSELQCVHTELQQVLNIEIHNLNTEVKQFISEGMVPVLKLLQDHAESLSMLPDLSERLDEIAEVSQSQLSTVTGEFQRFKITVEKQVQTLPQYLEHLAERRVVNVPQSPGTRAIRTAKVPLQLTEKRSGSKPNMTQFVVDCLKEDTEMSSSEVKRRGIQEGLEISDPLISMARKKVKTHLNLSGDGSSTDLNLSGNLTTDGSSTDLQIEEENGPSIYEDEMTTLEAEEEVNP